MINKKTLLLGGAAALFVTGVQAADMPKAPAREPVYRCDITGFIELPGTDICFKVGGHVLAYAVMAEDNVLGQSIFHSWKNVGSDFQHTTGDTLVMHVHGRLNFDARTQTEYGTLRAFIEMQAHDTNVSTGGPFDLRHAFIQFGNWTFGKTTRTLNPAGVTPHLTDYGVNGTLFAGQGSRPVQVRYTMPLGNGLSLAVAIEDPAFSNDGDYAAGFVAQVNAVGGVLVPPPAGFAVAQERNEVPDLVAQLSWAGSWGGFSIGGGIHQNVYAVLPLGTGVADRELGWRVEGGVYVKATSAVTLMARGSYSDGYNIYSGISIGDVLWNPVTGTINSTIEEWMVAVGANVQWAPQWKSGFFVAYATAEPSNVVGNWIGTGLTANQASIDVFQVMGNIFWTPVNNMQFGVEVAYVDADYHVPAPFNPVGNDAFSVVFEAKRSF
ncbi:MAG: porin [Flavobacteriaceae bacterium]